MKTAFTEAAGVEVPLICGAMYPCSNPELVAAVKETVHSFDADEVRGMWDVDFRRA